jgi:hypothetical protein
VFRFIGYGALVLLTTAILPARADDLLPILYSGDGDLCSVAPEEPGKTVCAHVAYEVDTPSWQPNGNRIVTGLGKLCTGGSN